MATKFASGRRAIAQCDRCDTRVLLAQLTDQVVKGRPTGVMVCQSCRDVDHPQLFQGLTPVSDPQAIRNPRPDRSLGADGSRGIQWGWGPVGGGNSAISGGTPNDLAVPTAMGVVIVSVSWVAIG